MKKIRCRLEYRDFNNRDLIQFCTQVSNGIFNDADKFDAPAVAHAVFTTAFTNYTDSVARYENAPKIEKTAMELARKEMIEILDLMRLYVDQLANGDESLINLSGFVPTKATVDKSTPLVATESFDVRRTTNLGEVQVEIHKQSAYDALWYFVICSTSYNLPANIVNEGVLDFSNKNDNMRINLSNGRTKVFSNLPTGTMYYFYVIAANSVSVSPISSPKGLQL